MNNRYFLLVAFLLAATTGAAQSSFNASGSWTGPRTQTDEIVPANLKIQLVQNAAGLVVGTVLIFDANDPSYYALMSATGTVSGNSFIFQETTFLIDIDPPGAVWCMRKGTLTFSSDGNTLSGTLSSAQCGNTATYTVSRTDISGLLVGNPVCLPGGTIGIGPCSTDPINIGSGNVYESFMDYSTNGANPLAFTRYYNSLPVTKTNAIALGSRWRSVYDRYLTVTPGNSATAERRDGQIVNFTFNANVWSPPTF